MKIIICLLSLLSVQIQASTQVNKIIKGYAFARQVLPGVARKTIVGEDGKIVTDKQSASFEYYFYVETNGAAKLTVKDVWIKGKNYIAEAKEVKGLPIVLSDGSHNSYSSNDTLVGTTNNRVWKIDVGSLNNDARNSSLIAHTILSNEILLEYDLNKQHSRFVISNIKMLRALTLE